jgi:hypothetical protein
MVYQFATSIPWFAWIAIIAIVSGSISSTACAWFKHRERMAMIRQGMNPDENASVLADGGRKPSFPEL